MVAPLVLALLVALLVPTSNLSAQVSVEVDNYLVDNSPTGGLLGIPRQQVMPLESGEVVVFVAGWEGKNLFLTPNLDAKAADWTDTLDLAANPQLSGADNHTHFSVDNDTIYAVLPVVGGDSLLVKVIGATSQDLFNVDYSYTPGYRAPGGWGNITVFRGGAWFVPGTDTLILVSRGHDGIGNDYMDIMSFVSPDRGRTWSDSIRVVDLQDAQDQTRIGAINFFNGTVSALIFSREHSSVLWYNWNRTQRRWDAEPIPLTGQFDRGYSGNVIDDTIQFVVCANGGIQDRDTLHYAYKT
ncbi:hypothetical protein GF377_07155, partial [candidate division GN15 bacterium]|nr:hypothetical protein [candidate division GN15 bacterium]